MPASEKFHNEQVGRIMRDKVRTWQPKEGKPGVEICYRKGKLAIRRCTPPSTLVELSSSKEAEK